MNHSSKFLRVIALVLVVSFSTTPLGVLAQEVESTPEVSDSGSSSSVGVDTPASDPAPAVSESPATPDESPAIASPSSDLTPSAEEAEPAEEKTDEPEATPEPKPTDEPEQPNLLESGTFPFEPERQPVNTNVRVSRPLANKRAKFQVGFLIRPHSEIG